MSTKSNIANENEVANTMYPWLLQGLLFFLLAVYILYINKSVLMGCALLLVSCSACQVLIQGERRLPSSPVGAFPSPAALPEITPEVDTPSKFMGSEAYHPKLNLNVRKSHLAIVF